jgi:methylmalonyl-CoA/ethylmalonyl-CoA epimerase
MAEPDPDPGREDQTSEPGISSVDHVGLAVSDLAAAVAFHTEVLGLRVLHREDNDEQGVAEVMLAGGGADSAGTGQTQIQLLAPLTETSPLTRFLHRSGPGVQHLAYRVKDADHAAEVLRRMGLRLLYDSARPGTRGSRINFVHPKDAGGVLIELVEPSAFDSESGDQQWGASSAQ